MFLNLFSSILLPTQTEIFSKLLRKCEYTYWFILQNRFCLNLSQPCDPGQFWPWMKKRKTKNKIEVRRRKEEVTPIVIYWTLAFTSVQYKNQHKLWNCRKYCLVHSKFITIIHYTSALTQHLDYSNLSFCHIACLI